MPVPQQATNEENRLIALRLVTGLSTVGATLFFGMWFSWLAPVIVMFCLVNPFVMDNIVRLNHRGIWGAMKAYLFPFFDSTIGKVVVNRPAEVIAPIAEISPSVIPLTTARLLQRYSDVLDITLRANQAGVESAVAASSNCHAKQAWRRLFPVVQASTTVPVISLSPAPGSPRLS